MESDSHTLVYIDSERNEICQVELSPDEFEVFQASAERQNLSLEELAIKIVQDLVDSSHKSQDREETTMTSGS